jgi:hypothetical protein
LENGYIYKVIKSISEDLVKVTPLPHKVRVVAILADPNVFPTTLATGGGDRRRQEKRMPSLQRSMVPSGGTRSLALVTPRHLRPSLE